MGDRGREHDDDRFWQDRGDHDRDHDRHDHGQLDRHDHDQHEQHDHDRGGDRDFGVDSAAAFDDELSRMMHRIQEPVPFEPSHRAELWAAIDRHSRVRRRRAAAGSVLALAAVLVGVLVLPSVFDGGSSDPNRLPPASPGVSGQTIPAPQPSATETPMPTTAVGFPNGTPAMTTDVTGTLGGGQPTSPPFSGNATGGDATPTSTDAFGPQSTQSTSPP